MGERAHGQHERHRPGGPWHRPRCPRPHRDEPVLSDERPAHLRGRGRRGISGPGERGVRPGPLRRIALVHGTSEIKIDLVPNGIYTTPEISSVGATERELTKQAIPYEIGHAYFRHLARAQISGQTVGMLKLLFHRETLRILGIHCFGDQASEIIHIGQAIMAQQGGANTILYFVNTTFNYPTMAEAYRVAALNGINRVFPDPQ